MRIGITKAREREHEYYFQIQGDLDDPEEDRWIEEFRYGKDIPPSQIRDEILAHILNSHGSHPETILGMEGAEVTV